MIIPVKCGESPHSGLGDVQLKQFVDLQTTDRQTKEDAGHQRITKANLGAMAQVNQNNFQRTKICNLKLATYDRSRCKMDHPNFIVSIWMEESISPKKKGYYADCKLGSVYLYHCYYYGE